MPAFATDTVNTLLNDLQIDQVSLHTAYSTGGANEVDSPGYARQTVDFTSAAGGVRRLVTTPILLSVAPGVTVAWAGLWLVSGAFAGMLPLGGILPRLYTLSAQNLSHVIVPGHGYSSGDQVVPWQMFGQPSPFGLNEGQIYTIIIVDDDTVQLSIDGGASALSFPTRGSGELQIIRPSTIGTDGTYTLIDIQLAMA